MKTWGRGALVLLLALEIAAVLTGRLSVGHAAGVLIGVEVGVAALVVILIVARTHRGTGPFLTRLEDGLGQVMPGVAAAAVVGEIRMARSLALLLTRRVDTRGMTDAVPIPYAAGRLVMPLVLGVVCVVELVVVDVVIPWDRFGPFAWLRWLVLAVSGYGVLWVVAWCAGERTHPHLATPEGLILRRGPFLVAEIPWNAVASVTRVNRLSPDPDRVTLEAPLVTPNLDIDLLAAVPTRGFFGTGPASSAFSLAVDDPDSAATLIDARVHAEPGATAQEAGEAAAGESAGPARSMTTPVRPIVSPVRR